MCYIVGSFFTSPVLNQPMYTFLFSFGGWGNKPLEHLLKISPASKWWSWNLKPSLLILKSENCPQVPSPLPSSELVSWSAVIGCGRSPLLLYPRPCPCEELCRSHLSAPCLSNTPVVPACSLFLNSNSPLTEHTCVLLSPSLTSLMPLFPLLHSLHSVVSQCNHFLS